MDKFLKFVEELSRFQIQKRLESRILSLVQVWAESPVLNEISAQAAEAGVRVEDLGGSLVLSPQEEEEAWPPF